MSKFWSYLKSQSIGWWISTSLLLGIVTLIAVPSWRNGIIVWINKQRLGDPNLQTPDTKQVLKDDVYTYRYELKDGSTHVLEEHKGEVMFINVWATWCTHCIAEFSSIEDLYDDYKNKVAFILYSYEERGIIQNFVNKYDYNLPICIPAKDNTFNMRASAYPTTYIVDKEGVIRATHKGAADWNSDEVRNLLDKLINE